MTGTSLDKIRALKVDSLEALEDRFKNPPVESRPGVRWWWFGSAVTPEEIRRQLEQMKEKGIGGVEIQPVYSALGGHEVAGHEDIEWLSRAWLDALAFTVETAKELGLGVDMTFGSGWPFGGPHVTPAMASKKLACYHSPAAPGERLEIELADLCEEASTLFSLSLVRVDAPPGSKRPVIDLRPKIDIEKRVSTTVPVDGEYLLCWSYVVPTGQRVKRAAPGAEGLVLDHLDRNAFKAHATRISDALRSRFGKFFGESFGAFFCDSWEVQGEIWKKGVETIFENHMGYDFAPYTYLLDPSFPLGELSVEERAILHDHHFFRSELVLKEFFEQFRLFCHEAGVACRAQPYTAPVDLLQAYGMLDILEIEGFGEEGISTRYYAKVDPRLASSAAHVYGKEMVSCESFTWLGEHFTTSLERLKQEADMIFLHGVNKIMYHGYPYSPPGAGRPGWVFYASVMANHNNTWWPHARLLNDYIARNTVLSLQGSNVADVAVYLPLHDEWSGKNTALESVRSALLEAGMLSSFDYVNDGRIVNAATVDDGRLRILDNQYECLLLYHVEYMPTIVASAIANLVAAGMRLVIVGSPPSRAPGLMPIRFSRQGEVKEIFDELEGQEDLVHHVDKLEDLPALLSVLGTQPDFHAMKVTVDGVEEPCLEVKHLHRRVANIDLYMVVNTGTSPVHARLTFRAVGPVTSWDPLDGSCHAMEARLDGKERVSVGTLLHGKELRWFSIDRSSSEGILGGPGHLPLPVPFPDEARENTVAVDGPWEITFESPPNSFPERPPVTIKRKGALLFDWASDPGLEGFSGNATYETTVNIDPTALGRARRIILSLGVVLEIATVRINGKDAGTSWQGTRELEVGGCLKAGENVIQITVTNLLINEVIGHARRGDRWMPDYYFVNTDYKPFSPESMHPLPSGLLGPVSLWFVP